MLGIGVVRNFKMLSYVNRAVFTLTLCLWAAVCQALPVSIEDDRVLAGYRRFYSGDKVGAQQDFDQLAREQPAGLAARFGSLTVLLDRSEADRSLEPVFERGINALLADAEARHRRSQTDDEALFYLSNGHMLRARYRFDHDKGMWGAARDGANAKRYSEAFVARHPESGDGYFVLGAYNYYVELAPAFFKVVRVFLFLPSGSRVEGLKQLDRAYQQGSLFAFQAGMLLMEIYGAFEGRPDEGVRVGERLTRDYPDNPEVPFSLAELYSNPGVENHERAAQQYASIVERWMGKSATDGAPYRALQALASTRVQQWRGDEAIALLTKVVDAPPALLPGVLPSVLLQRANVRAQLDDPRASDDIHRVLGDPRWKDHHPGASRMMRRVTERRATGEAAVYAALIPGNRLVASRRFDEARQAYETVQRQHAQNAQVRFRLAQLAFVSGQPEVALPEFTALTNAGKDAPPWLRAQAWVYVGRTHDLAARRDQARKAYQYVVDNYESEGATWSARIGLITPYRRPVVRAGS